MATTDGQEATDDDSAGASWHTRGRGPEREDMAAQYLPDQHDWDPKTVLDVNDPARVAALRNFGSLFPEIADKQTVIDEFLDNYLKAQTSVHGQSRRDYKDILLSMFGGRPQDDSGDMLARALAADIEDDD